jgi:F-type H+-transporting ATPase subunit gamma
MANLKEVRNRISSVISTQQITKAMKMVSAAKLRRAQDAIVMMRPYAAKLREIMENISGNLDSSSGGDFAKVRPVQKVLIVAINSNRGLCGAFNSNIIRTTNRLLREDYATQAKQGNVKVLCIGKKAADFYSNQ